MDIFSYSSRFEGTKMLSPVEVHDLANKYIERDNYMDLITLATQCPGITPDQIDRYAQRLAHIGNYESFTAFAINMTSATQKDPKIYHDEYEGEDFSLHELLEGVKNETLAQFVAYALKKESLAIFGTVAIVLANSFGGRGFEQPDIQQAVDLCFKEKTIQQRDEKIANLAEELYGYHSYIVRHELMDWFFDALAARGVVGSFISSREKETYLLTLGPTFLYVEGDEPITTLVSREPSSFDLMIAKMLEADEFVMEFGLRGLKETADINSLINADKVRRFVDDVQALADRAATPAARDSVQGLKDIARSKGVAMASRGEFGVAFPRISPEL